MTFDEIAVAVAGMLHAPFAPRTTNVAISPEPSGADRVPTAVGAGLVSTRRHGTIGTNDDAVPDDTAFAIPKPPTPKLTATAAPIAAHLLLETSAIIGP